MQLLTSLSQAVYRAALTVLRLLFAFGTHGGSVVAWAPYPRYAHWRAMNTLRSILVQRPAPTALPAVIHLPDASAASGRASAEQKPSLTKTFSFSSANTKTVRKRLLILLAAVAVPAMAAPGDFGAMPGAALTEEELVQASPFASDAPQSEAQTTAMEFEEAGMTFPGSAFFFLADPPSETLIALPTSDALESGAGEGGRAVGTRIDAGPAARPFFSVSGTSHMRAEECLAQAIWYEAASESEAGQRAVAQVVLNRVAHRSWPGSVCGVVYQGSQRATGCQFTFTCDGSLRRTPRGRSWESARAIAGEALSGSVYAPVGHATHYHTLWVNPYWASSLDHVGTIGAHRFYRNRGAAGAASAFSGRYAGVEPGVAERGSIPSPATPIPTVAADGASTQGGSVALSGGAGQSQAAQAITPAPILADPSLGGVGQVRQDYARAGQWRSDAAREALEADAAALATEEAELGSRHPAP